LATLNFQRWEEDFIFSCDRFRQVVPRNPARIRHFSWATRNVGLVNCVNSEGACGLRGHVTGFSVTKPADKQERAARNSKRATRSIPLLSHRYSRKTGSHFFARCFSVPSKRIAPQRGSMRGED
jgi:hypothetical protein